MLKVEFSIGNENDASLAARIMACISAEFGLADVDGNPAVAPSRRTRGPRKAVDPVEQYTAAGGKLPDTGVPSSAGELSSTTSLTPPSEPVVETVVPPTESPKATPAEMAEARAKDFPEPEAAPPAPTADLEEQRKAFRAIAQGLGIAWLREQLAANKAEKVSDLTGEQLSLILAANS